ncbi:TPA: Dot/Icm T4SS effector RavT [Legionella pneumophila]|uniref:Uncharacterized protein n=3 Tax=Legionella pneumophila TaxID=446 RepID=Q5ZVX2_LEGPH|nr:Dot/Icm T4SS effector RavT [Legionella pneumophila]WBV64591.1 Dot/Icm T4SS effector RavT [Legionella pneumophila 130b]AAU27399.1 hypothetical protein lpg1316 [Legionella pneumophila subsp. pneumophila str. Philadelphia 1]AEW51520.1 hypothetical protein lp12_1254 [Legionella pneumophila subsp. pneumophila ATCC 43290]MCK0183501.1 Dot/Icm T4SS effector RavT [Legionella pneumophila]MCK1860335.1 Dot/Icm T4SS effector RavT [Legionella pneumophila]
MHECVIQIAILGYKRMYSKLLRGAATAVAGYVSYVLLNETKREHEIKSKEEIKDCEDLVKNSSEFKEIGRPIHGTLSSSYVQHIETGNIYVKKGAHSRRDLVKELMVSNALHKIREDQPECLIMQTPIKNGFQYHTLSRKFDHTQDVEEFVRNGRIDELRKKEVIGLGDTLITDHIFGKQSDTKLANMVVRDKQDKLIFTSIDHERAVNPTSFSFFHPTPPIYTKNKSTLIRSINDLGEQSEDNHAGLAGDPRAKEFGEVVENVINNLDIDNYYQKVATTNLSSVISQCEKLAKASKGRLVQSEDCAGYESFFKEMQRNAKNQLESSKPQDDTPVLRKSY